MEIQSTYQTGIKTEKDYFDRLCDLSLLVLDDLGTEQISEWSISRLYLLLAKRINEEKQTVITTNMSGDDVKAWNPRIYSRLQEFVRISCGDDDRRVRNSARKQANVQ